LFYFGLKAKGFSIRTQVLGCSHRNYLSFYILLLRMGLTRTPT
jgi:hypothetical protein